MSNESSRNNKRIAKNTLALYFRQIVVLGITFFTYRIVLQTLGVIDYGIYNVVGGIVLMFYFLTGTLTGITQRFINVEMEKGCNETIHNIFSASLVLYFIFGLLILIIGQTLGAWFIKEKLVIPAERMPAAMLVFQFALLGFILSNISAPFIALVIAHEDMHIYGYAGIFEVILRLIAVYLLVIINDDKLITWSVFGFIISCAAVLFYAVYCRKKYSIIRFSFFFDVSLFKELIRYGGFIFFNNILYILRTQGVNVILNIFFGPAVNAARGLANSIDSALLSFGNNFRSALNPQLTKSCARGDSGYMWTLFDRGTRISYFLILIFSVPVLLQAEFILRIWLNDVPEYTVIFTRLIIINALLESFIAIFNVIVNASGILKAYYFVHYAYMILIFAFSYLVCKMGYSPHYVFIVPFPLLLLSIPVRFAVMKKIVDFPVKFFIKKSFLPVFFVSVLSFLPFYFLNRLFTESNVYSAGIIAASILWTGMVIVCIGLSRNERIIIFNFVRHKIIRKKF